MRAGTFLRFFSIYFIVVAIIFYNVNDAFSFNFILNEKNDKTPVFLRLDNGVLEEEKPTEIPKNEEKETVSNLQSTEQKSEQVSAEAVKGKIESRYISPYTVSTHYDKIYLKNSTDLKLDIKALFESKLGFKIQKSDEPQVLIMHTHTTESYVLEDKGYYTEEYTSRNTDNNKNMAALGKIVTDILNAEGIKTLHDVTQHDYPKYSGSYTRAAKTVNAYLKKYPSIKIVLDIHRDAISAGGNDKVKLVTEIDGKKAAQVMLVMGSNSGSTDNHPKWQENLKLALKLQQTIENDYPTLARPLSLMPKNYNQSLTTGSLLLEIGTDANTLDEAKYSASLVGKSLAHIIRKQIS